MWGLLKMWIVADSQANGPRMSYPTRGSYRSLAAPSRAHPELNVRLVAKRTKTESPALDRALKVGQRRSASVGHCPHPSNHHPFVLAFYAGPQIGQCKKTCKILTLLSGKCLESTSKAPLIIELASVFDMPSQV